jgi:pyruvate dehydrogenase E2 component (dihydrolipoyllysine-residue acetyltransferase)
MSEATDLLNVEVPDIGDFDDVPIIEILVSPGDAVAADDPLLTLESDKATMDVPAPSAGVVRELHVGVGDRVSQGTLLLTLEPSGAAPAHEEIEVALEAEEAAAPAELPPADGRASATARSASGLATAGPGLSHPAIYASPSVRRVARELGVDLDDVAGTGRNGRITVEDVRQRSGGGPARLAPAGPGSGLAAATGPREERVPLKRIQKIAAPRLTQSWTTIPHVTHNDLADITELEAWRKQLNAEQDVKVTMVAFLVLACVAALREFPTFNSSLDGDELIVKRYYNIGFAADTPGGLVVPVIKEADRLGLLEIASQLSALSGKAREGKLGPAEMQGATFTISSLGGIGGTSFTPIINPPEVAILGVTRAAMKPVWSSADDQFVPRLMVPLSLSYDHRVIDGAAAARFVVHLGRVLSDLRRALL